MGERCISAKQNVTLRLKAKKSPKRKGFCVSAAKYLERPHKYWPFRDMGNEIDNPVRGRKHKAAMIARAAVGNEIDNPARGRKHSFTIASDNHTNVMR